MLAANLFRYPARRAIVQEFLGRKADNGSASRWFLFVDRIDTYWQDYIIAVGNVLKSILIHLIQTLPRDDLDPCERPPWAVYVLDRLPQLWSIIVNHPRVTTFDVAYHENGHKGAAPFLQLRDMMSDLLTLYTALYPPQR